MSSVKLYVGNLSFKASEQELTELFSQAGAVTSATIITDKNSGRSKGFAFVEMSSEEDANKAKEMFNSFSYLERPLIVSDAKPQEKKTFGDRNSRRPNTSRNYGNNE
jgi:RNA recognition motif-containing protein